MGSYYDLNAAPILDIGCGDGDFVRYAQGLGHRAVTAVDIDTAALAPLAGLDGVQTIEAAADADFVNALDGQYQLIVVKQMLYYLTRREAVPFVAALRDRLAPGGILLVEIYNAAMASGRYPQAKDPFIQTAYSDKGLIRLLQSQGLTVSEVFGVSLPKGGPLRWVYDLAARCWFSLWRTIMILERGRDDELPTIRAKSIIAIARR
jgi:SAM-dependent methyltransferase